MNLLFCCLQLHGDHLLASVRHGSEPRDGKDMRRQQGLCLLLLGQMVLGDHSMMRAVIEGDNGPAESPFRRTKALRMPVCCSRMIRLGLSWAPDTLSLHQPPQNLHVVLPGTPRVPRGAPAPCAATRLGRVRSWGLTLCTCCAPPGSPNAHREFLIPLVDSAR